jgi:PIN domain
MALVLDTHALIWHLSGSKELSRVARTMIATEEKNDASIFVSAISLVEVVYLAERGRLLPQRCTVWKMLWRIRREAWWLRHWMPGWLALSREFPALLSRICRTELSRQLLCTWTRNS